MCIPVVFSDMAKRLPLNIFGDFIAFLVTLCLGVNAFPQGFAVLTDFFAGFGNANGREDAERNGVPFAARAG